MRVESESLFSELCAYWFGDGLPSGLKHHVVTHVLEENLVGSVRACSRAHVSAGERAVIFTVED